jgi:ATP-dependent protease ClpP protease subunit
MFRILSKSADRAEVVIYGDIGPVFWGDEVSASDFAATLKEVGAVKALDVRINSYGGDVFDGLAIYRQLVEHPASVTIHVDGIAASAASVVAMAGDVIRIGESARMMIHDAWTIAAGDAAAMRSIADRLDETSQAIAEIYSARSGRTPTEMRDAMRAETWYTGKEAVAAKLATEVAANKPAPVSSVDGKVVALDQSKHRFSKTPKDLLPNRQAAMAAILQQQVAITKATAAAAVRKS